MVLRTIGDAAERGLGGVPWPGLTVRGLCGGLGVLGLHQQPEAVFDGTNFAVDEVLEDEEGVVGEDSF